MHTGPMKDSDGDFDEWQPSQHESTKCHKCASKKIQYRTWDSSCGGYTDYNFRCLDCNYSWWIDGIDS